MTIKEKNNFHKDFSNRKPYNDIPCRPGEVLVPVVLDKEMKETLEPMGLNKENAEKWKLNKIATRWPAKAMAQFFYSF